MGTGGAGDGAAPSDSGVPADALALADRSALGLVQRILLTTDGTVTHILEAYAGEPIHVVKLSHSLVPGSELDPTEEGKVLRRAILLQGSDTGRNLLYADSLISLSRLPGAVGEGLIETDIPVGRLLFENRVETFREFLAFGEEPAGEAAAHFGLDPAETLVYRTYQIVAEGRPLMRITEKFPSAAFLS